MHKRKNKINVSKSLFPTKHGYLSEKLWSGLTAVLSEVS